MLLGPTAEPVRALSAGRPDVAERLLAPGRGLAGERLRLEAVYPGRQGTGAGSLRLVARTVGLADQPGVRAVLTNWAIGVRRGPHDVQARRRAPGRQPDPPRPASHCAASSGADTDERSPGLTRTAERLGARTHVVRGAGAGCAGGRIRCLLGRPGRASSRRRSGRRRRAWRRERAAAPARRPGRGRWR